MSVWEKKLYFQIILKAHNCHFTPSLYDKFTTLLRLTKQGGNWLRGFLGVNLLGGITGSQLQGKPHSVTQLFQISQFVSFSAKTIGCLVSWKVVVPKKWCPRGKRIKIQSTHHEMPLVSEIDWNLETLRNFCQTSIFENICKICIISSIAFVFGRRHYSVVHFKTGTTPKARLEHLHNNGDVENEWKWKFMYQIYCTEIIWSNGKCG